jgi:hypothetical protein
VKASPSIPFDAILLGVNDREVPISQIDASCVRDSLLFVAAGLRAG